MRILISGGFGYIGSICAERLKSQGNEITIIARKIPYYIKDWSKDFNVIIGDITDENFHLKVIDKKYDCMIHFAAASAVKCIKEPSESILINNFGTANMLETCVKRGIKRFIYISTFHVYGKPGFNQVINEESNIKSSDLYGLTHYFSELITKYYTTKNNLIGTSIRLSNCSFTPLFRDNNKFYLIPNSFVKQAYENSEIIINSSGLQKRNFLSGDDLCNAINIIIDKQNLKYDVFNVGSEKEYSINEIAKLVKDIGEELIKDKKIDIIHNIKFEADEETNWRFDISKIKQLGFKGNGNINDDIKKSFNLLMRDEVHDGE